MAGLRPEIKAKVVGVDGGFEELLVKARFEEVKLRELAKPGDKQYQKKATTTTGTTPHAGLLPEHSATTSTTATPSELSSKLKCFACGSYGHMQRNCPERNKGGSREAPGHYKSTTAIYEGSCFCRGRAGTGGILASTADRS